MPWQFTTKVYQQRKRPYLDVPPYISAAMSEATGSDGYLAVFATLNEREIEAVLVPRGSGAYRLFIDTQIRRLAKLETGDVVNVILRLDKTAQADELPADLAEIFTTDTAAQTAFEQLTAAKRSELLKWLALDKKDEPRQKRLEHLRDFLTTIT
jgi:Bacteriocin-protection, YdeI or OmpD-Associated/Domain of unknown function (DUF1905)